MPKLHPDLQNEQQIKEVEKVKRFEAGFVFNPVVLFSQNTLPIVDDEDKL